MAADIIYDRTLFEGVNDDAILDWCTCVICKCIAKRPVDHTCNAVYCKDCIQQWVNLRHTTCPACTQPLPSRLTVSATLDNRVSRMDMKCINHPKGCTHIIRCIGKDSTKIKQHVDTCLFDTVTCQQCNQQGPRGELPHHQQHTCRYRIVTCLECRRQYQAHQHNQHSMMICDACEQGVAACCMRTHTTSTCPQRQVQCEYCHVLIRADQQIRHDADSITTHMTGMMKRIQTVHEDNTTLTSEMEALRSDNTQLQACYKNSCCYNRTTTE